MTTTTMDAHCTEIPAPEKPESNSRLREIAIATTFLFGIGTAFTALLGAGLLVFVGE